MSTTRQIDLLAAECMKKQGTTSATGGYQPAGYPPYPASLCSSLNDVVCHGIPDDRPLKDGDIVNIDVTIIKNGWHGDNSRMYVVGEGSIAARRLCQITFEAMWKGIVKVKPGARLGDIGHAIQVFAEHAAFSEGIEIHELEARRVKVYSVAKTIADLFKARLASGLAGPAGI